MQEPDEQTREALSELPDSLQPERLPRALFGYDRSTIVELLDRMGDRIRALTQERVDRERQVNELERELQRSRDNQRLIGETLISAREEAEAIREDARREASNVMQSSQKQASRIVEEAEHEAGARARQVVEEARREGQTLVDDARRMREAVLDEAGRARAFVEETHEQLSDFLMAAVKWYEQAKPTGSEAQASVDVPSSPANERNSIPSS